MTCHDTKRLAARFFEYDDLGTLQLKGFEEGMRAWRVVRKSLVVSRFDAQRYDESRGEIIGRGDVLAALSDAWSDARRARTGRTICLVGEAGIGKSRLARAALDLARRDGGTVLNIDCMPSTGNTPLFPIGVLLRRIANITREPRRATRARRATALLTRFLAAGDVPRRPQATWRPCSVSKRPARPVDQTPDQVRDQTIAIVVRILRALIAHGSVGAAVRRPALGGRHDGQHRRAPRRRHRRPRGY